MWDFLERLCEDILEICFVLIMIPIVIVASLLCLIIAGPIYLICWIFNIDGLRKGLV